LIKIDELPNQSSATPDIKKRVVDLNPDPTKVPNKLWVPPVDITNWEKFEAGYGVISSPGMFFTPSLNVASIASIFASCIVSGVDTNDLVF